jgi:probable HAF family extracellular repeat protein
MVDLGTLGGVNSEANWVNDAGDVVGRADLPGSNSHDAFLWKNGSMTDLGKPQGQSCSTANSINNRDQVVGTTGVCFVGGGPPFLWQKGTLYDLQALVGPTALRLTEALYINDQGEIAGLGVLPNGDQHVVLLVPAALAASEGLRSNAPAARSATSSMVRPSSPAYVGRLPRPLTPRLRAHRSLTG